MTRNWSAVIPLVASTWAASSAPVDTSKIAELEQLLVKCFDLQAQRLDDGHSDARSVAAAVYAACGPEKTAILTAAGMAAQLINRTLHDAREQDIDRATISVLNHRAKPR